MTSLEELWPAILTAFIVQHAAMGLAKCTVREGAGAIRVFLPYLYREGVADADLSGAVGWPQVYRLSSIPRSISWADVNRVLAGGRLRRSWGGETTPSCSCWSLTGFGPGRSSPGS